MELPITDIKGAGSEGLEKGVSGILGMDFLSRFDVKLDFRNGERVFVFVDFFVVGVCVRTCGKCFLLQCWVYLLFIRAFLAD